MCIFCKIIKQEIPSYKVYEDDKVFAFLDNRPVNSGHSLVIPKTHCQNLEEISDDDLVALIRGVKKVGRLLKEKLGVSGYNVIENNDPIAGQGVSHLHFHIIPRLEGDNLKHWPGQEYKVGEAESILEKLNK